MLMMATVMIMMIVMMMMISPAFSLLLKDVKNRLGA